MERTTFDVPTTIPSELIVASVATPILVTDLGGRIAYANPAAEALWQYPPDGLTGVPLRSLVAVPHRFELARVRAELGESAVLALEGSKRDGSTFGLNLRFGQRIRGQDLVVVSAEDVTAQRESQSRLQHAVDVAEGCARRKSEMLATLSHEIRTPIGVVLGWVEILADSSLSDDQREICKSIDRNATNLMNLVNDVLDYSKGEARKLKLESIAFDLRGLLGEVAELFAETAARKGIRFEYCVDANAPSMLRGDPRRLRQILINLVGNAIKFTERGSVLVRVTTDPSAADRYRFEVVDSGIGISPEAQAHLFEAFTQASPATSRRYGGSGLGLAICRQLVDLMGGQIGFDCTAGRGSTFWFNLPLADSKAPASRGRTVAAEEQVVLRVLVAEDNPANRVVAVGLLEKLGHCVDAVVNGLEVIDALRDKEYDVILMDIWMPEMDGLVAAQRIAELQPPERRPQVIALTADGTPETRLRCARAGMVDYVTKPLSQERLGAALDRVALSLSA